MNSSNKTAEFYSNQVISYNENYDLAIGEIDKIISSLVQLNLAFYGAVGNDPALIRGNISTTIHKLQQLKTSITNNKQQTNNRVESCKRCFNKYLNKSYPGGSRNGRNYIEGAYIDINSNGQIVTSQEYTKVLSIIESLFMSSAGECYEENVVSIEEMFNS